ncbi:hypothetical protein JG687_00011966 [Phytophthora cactorum]|uniref:Uncharacterized protein n=1 Tax=Phytophthora cactorum TaxID=29920 RepID=A0A329RSC2_9STRA|nr:hypothetical protein Pcac1_g15769 [Phytophthora cactorum]KAG2810719.1 hypothetical protein PC112_g15931 [Phytophthora cactorum]KAG2834686.1 hypothetical protein PC111_g5723 [Phytophthora cactorum]KAG2861574.1 hypothetical protein PC113_g7045 [Phytophthora cactorum]KAG2902570.1 hypothetical protein PC115_g15543 [Phytophthora cactorum]
MTVIQDAAGWSPTSDTTIHPPTRAAAKAATSMVAKERVVAHATDNPTICRVRQLPREEQEVDMQGSDELCTALDSA